MLLLVSHRYLPHFGNTIDSKFAIPANHIAVDHEDSVRGLVDVEVVISLPTLAEDLYLLARSQHTVAMHLIAPKYWKSLPKVCRQLFWKPNPIVVSNVLVAVKTRPLLSQVVSTSRQSLLLISADDLLAGFLE